MVFVLFYKLKLVLAVGIKLHENLTIHNTINKTIIKLRTLKQKLYSPPKQDSYESVYHA